MAQVLTRSKATSSRVSLKAPAKGPGKTFLAMLDAYLAGDINAGQLDQSYFPWRRSQREQGTWFGGAELKVVEKFEYALDSFSERPDPTYLEIGDAELREEANIARAGLLKLN